MSGVSNREFFSTFGRIGLLSFGGPAGQIALMHRVLVDEKKWLGEPRFLHALSFCMLLPGPEAMQLAAYSGWLLRGALGGLAAGLLFILPGAVLIIALSALYMMFGDLPLVSGLLFGLKAAVLAVVAEALIRVGKRAFKGRGALMIAAASFIGIAFFKLPFPLIIALAALCGALMHWLAPIAATGREDFLPSAPVRLGRHFAQTGLWLAAWLAPLALMTLALGRANVFTGQAWFFSKAAVVTFGGAYAVLAYVAQQAVEVYHWLEPGEMLTGLGLAETTPGPLILVLVFTGFLGGARLGGIGEFYGGLAGAAVTLWFTFAPCFLWVMGGAPFVERLRGIAWLSEALAAVTAAVTGVIANLSLWFALHVLFGAVGEWRAGPLHLPVPEPATLDPWAALIAAVSGMLLLRLHWSLFWVLGLAAASGAVLRLLGM